MVTATCLYIEVLTKERIGLWVFSDISPEAKSNNTKYKEECLTVTITTTFIITTNYRVLHFTMANYYITENNTL